MDEPGEHPSLARTIGRAAMSVVVPVVEERVSTVVLLVYMVLFIPVGVVVFIATGAVFAILMAVLGTPTGVLGSILGWTWFGGTLVLMFALFVLLYRRLPRRLREAAGAAPPAPVAHHPATARRRRQPTLAELDARFAPGPPPPFDPPGA
jgi:hypothetical protein